MPIHDWSRVPAGIFHHFRQDWSVEISRGLNRGVLIAMGEILPAMPLFLTPRPHVLVPLESMYEATWSACPAAIRALVEGKTEA